MFRGFFRLVGLLLLAGAFVFVVYDGARSIADQSLRFMRLGEFWNDVNQASQALLRARIEEFSPAAWNNGLRVLLDQPVWLVMGVLGLALMFACRPRKRLIGYTR